ncbi:transcription factor WRKY19-like [Panicum virgatum]|uniref:transcription factor WRKY19-like n=1 Tax=Panicum virgatum TaxID=38727 RepID=UPI0019D67231|nr:transcription factor WRKY19-like [Panicum virgatum]
MKHHGSSMGLPQPSVSSDRPSLVCDHHRPAMKEVARGQSLVTQLRAIVLPALQADERSEIVAQMFQSILDCSSKAMAELQQLHRSRNARPDDDDVLVDDKKRVRRISSDCCSKEEGVNTGTANQCFKKPAKAFNRRLCDDSVSLETPVPHYDGRQWRKYGQKHINNAKHPRSYYRCTYRQEQGCKATKTVQQQDDSSGADHPLMYTVVYHGQHTCKDNDGVNSGADESEINARSSSDTQSSISSTCTDTYDQQTSLHDNKLIDKSEDVYEPFDMAAFAPLDLDSWELDALLRFGSA